MNEATGTVKTNTTVASNLPPPKPERPVPKSVAGKDDRRIRCSLIRFARHIPLAGGEDDKVRCDYNEKSGQKRWEAYRIAGSINCVEVFYYPPASTGEAIGHSVHELSVVNGWTTE